jgi:hypothetical protein
MTIAHPAILVCAPMIDSAPDMPFSLPEPTPVLGLMEVDAVEDALNRSRASVYRYANTDPYQLNLPYNPKRLNPEIRSHHTDPLLFHPSEVARFAKEVLKIKQVTIEVQNRAPDPTQDLLMEILLELKSIHQTLRDRP